MTYEEAIKRVKNSCYLTNALTMNDAIKDNIAINMAIKALEKQAEIVHCKECKHWAKGSNPFSNAKVCGLAGYFVGENGFCVYGERCDE